MCNLADKVEQDEKAQRNKGITDIIHTGDGTHNHKHYADWCYSVIKKPQNKKNTSRTTRYYFNY